MKKRVFAFILFLVFFVPALSGAVFASPGNISVYLNQSNRGELLSLLNSNALNKDVKYVLQSDFVISASELLDTFLPGQDRPVRSRYATFLSSLDGNGKTITVVADNSVSARPLFHNIGSADGSPTVIENLTVRYKGDAKVSAFMSGIARNAVFRNIRLYVEGDIVASADYFSDNANFFAHGFGYEAADCSFENISLTVGTGSGGGIIGQTSKTVSERLDSGENGTATTAVGFFYSMRDVDITKVDIFAKQINAVGDAGASAAGFAGSVEAGADGGISGITVSVSESITARQQTDGAAVVTGAYGFARQFDKLNGALITAGSVVTENSNISASRASATEAAGFGCVVSAGDDGVFGNTLRVNGDISASALGAAIAAGGYISRGTAGQIFATRGNAVEILGDVSAGGGTAAGTSGAAVSAGAYGFFGGTSGLSSKDDSVFVSGTVSAVAKSGDAAACGFASVGANAENAVVLISALSAYAETGGAYVSGFTDSFAANAAQKNNYVRVGGNVTAKAPAAIAAAGYSRSSPGQGVSIENCTVNITGNIEAVSSADNPSFAVAGFLRGISGGTAARNTAVLSGNISLTGENAPNSSASAGAFLAHADSGAVINNAVLFEGDVFIDSKLSGSAAKSNFIAELSGAEVMGNAVFGPFGLDKAPKDFFISSLAQGAAAYTVTDNVYAAMSGNERVSHPLDFSSAGGVPSVTPATLENPLHILTSEKISSSAQLLRDQINGVFSFSAAGSGGVTVSESGGATSVTRKSLMDGSENLMPYVTVFVTSGETTVVRDIVGADSGKAGSLSGTVFYDNDNNGRFDGTDGYSPSVSLDLKFKGTAVKTAVTAADGTFSFEMPLVSAAAEDYSLSITAPENYIPSRHSANKFRDGAAALEQLHLDREYKNIDGILTPLQYYQISFVTNAGAGISPAKAAEGDRAAEPAEPQRDGYAFSGWFSDSELSRQYDFSAPVLGDVTLYAKWVELPKSALFSLKYDGAGHTGGTVPESHELPPGGDVIIPPEKPVKEGYIFGGWRSGYSGELFPPGAGFKMPSSDVALTAEWSADSNSYTVKFDALGGSEISALGNMAYGSKIPRPENPSKEGFIFEGWYTDESLGTKWIFESGTIEGDTTLFAKWSPDAAAETAAPDDGDLRLDETGFPLSGIDSGRWGAANAFFSLCCAVLSAVTAVKAVKRFGSAKKGSSAAAKLMLAFLGLFITVASVIFFLAASDFSRGAALIDRWTWLSLSLTALETVILTSFRKPE